MLNQHTQVFKIGQPSVSRGSNALDTVSISEVNTLSSDGYSAYGFSSLLQRNTSRLSLYSTYNSMDDDPDIHRIIDTFADECCTLTEDGAPFQLQFNTTETNFLDNKTTEVLNTLLIKWMQITKISSRIFDIVRQTLKYGDCFFCKLSDLSEWLYIPTQCINGVEVDDTGDIIKYHVSLDSYSRIGNVLRTKLNNMSLQNVVIPTENMVHFSLSNMMNDNAPFGDSILFPALKYYKYLIMIESSILIYRIVRSPERRKFKIYTGNMQPIKQKAYIENLKRELYQKRVHAHNESEIDSIYNAMSIGEDFFFTVDKEGKGSDVETLPAGQSLGQLDDVMYFRHKVNNCLGVPTSYINPSDPSGRAIVQDGKVGMAYIEEQRFNTRIVRIQKKLEPTADKEFKSFVASCGINIDETAYNITMQCPQNFNLHKQMEVDSAAISLFNQIANVPIISKRFALEKYLKLSKEDINNNEILLRQEIGLSNEVPDQVSITQMLYDDKCIQARSINLPEHDTYNSEDVTNAESGDMSGADAGGGFGDLFGGSAGGMSGFGEAPSSTMDTTSFADTSPTGNDNTVATENPLAAPETITPAAESVITGDEAYFKLFTGEDFLVEEI